MMPSEKRIQQTLWLLMLVSFIIRALMAAFTELGNDEVYYWTYAKFPDWSHFDHPPMVGWVIQLFTLNLHFDSEFFIRLAAIVFGTINNWLIFLVGKQIKDSLTGLYAAFLFTASFYCFVISGTFIMPDTPQVLFWLLSLLLLSKALPDKNLTASSRYRLLGAGLTMGLAMLSKYHSVFLIIGAFLYILIFNRKWFRAKETYAAFILAILLFTPVILWNYHNQFISFTFHESRVGPSESSVRLDYLFTEIIGQVFYNNPVNFIIIVIAFLFLIKGKIFLERQYLYFLLLISLPLSLVFLSFSLYSSTLPHWTGPAYLGFMLIAAAFLRFAGERRSSILLFPWSLRIALVLPLIIITGGITQINYGWLPFQKLRSEDFSSQLFGWRQLGDKFALVAKKYSDLRLMPEDAPIITFRWFPAANLDYYVATPLGHKLYALGTLTRIHKYYWIDKERGNLKKGTSSYYIALSDDYQYPGDLFGKIFDTIYPPDTISIYRRNEIIRKAYIYRLIGLKKEINFDLITNFIEPSVEKIRQYEIQIMTNPGWMLQLKEKARKQGRTVDDLLWQEAKWTAEREMFE